MIRTEILMYATTWINLENIILSERNQTKKVTYMIHLYEMSRRNKSI